MYDNTKYMPEYMAKKMICEIGRRLYGKGFVAANDGNISVRVGPDAVICTPTGVSKGFMKTDMLVKLNLKGEKIAGSYKPSSEIKMHLRVYGENEEALAVVHAHPPKATSFAVAGIPLDKAILSEAVVLLGAVPVAPYATPGTEEVPDSIAPYCKDHNAVLLANHGALTWGKDIMEAYFRMESLEHYAGILMYSSYVLKKTNELSKDRIMSLMEVANEISVDPKTLKRASKSKAHKEKGHHSHSRSKSTSDKQKISTTSEIEKSNNRH